MSGKAGGAVPGDGLTSSRTSVQAGVSGRMTAPTRITFRLLGRFAATVDDGAAGIVQISAPMRRGLIAYLATQPGMTETRERLATLLWGERSDKQARQNLRQSLMQLRKEFE